MRVSRPRDGEPVRLTLTRSGEPRYRVTTDVPRADGRRQQVSRNFATLGAARAWLIEAKASMAAGTFVAADRTTFDEVADRWLAARSDIRGVTVAGYRHYLKPVRSVLGRRRVQELRRSDIESAVATLAATGGRKHKGSDGEWVTSPASHRTVVVTLGVVRQVFDYAVTEGIVNTNPARDVKAPRKRHDDGQEVTVWQPDELLAFRRAADADPWAGAWRRTLCGLRRSEVLGLAWAAVDLEAGTLVVRAGRVRVDGGPCDTLDDPKSRASWRTVPFESIHPGSAGLLRAMRRQQATDKLAAGAAYRDTGLLLVDALGQPVRPEVYSDRFRRLCVAAEVPVVRLHSVRHTLASILHRAGEAPADAAALLGHSVEVHLSTYVVPTERGVASAASRLGSVLAGVV